MHLEERGFGVLAASSAAEGARLAAKAQPSVIVLDMRLPDGSGIDLLPALREQASESPVLIITAHHDMASTILAMKAGAFDYLHKPIDIEAFDLALGRALELRRLSRAPDALPVGTLDPLEGLVGTSRPMQRLFKELGKVSASRATVLIQGESGTGKEMIARILHSYGQSPGETKPFVAINCSALVDSLLESELFGHEKGAFTGAVQTKLGRFELAQDGTVFLDEIGDMSISVQGKLLRVLQEREFERVGGTRTIQVRARVLAATHRDLAADVRAGLFRGDLYQRLKVVTLRVPPLRERKDDIPALVESLLARINQRLHKRLRRVPRQSLLILQEREWLGNVREMSYDDFEPPKGTFTVLVDYPWDEQGHTVDEDRLRAANFRKMKGNRYTVCWLPRHMTPNELGVLTEVAAVRHLLSDAGQEELLATLGPQDRSKVVEQAGVRAQTLSGQLDELLREVYVQHGEFLALTSDIDGSRPHKTLPENLVHITTLLMDRQFPQHPQFGAEPKKQDLDALLTWMVQAGETNVSVAYDEATAKVLRSLGQPLELVNLGQTKASLRLDSRYIKDVLQRTDHDSVRWEQVAEHLREIYGFQPLVSDLFLAFLCQRDHRALQAVSGESMEVKIGMSPALSDQVQLQRGMLVGAADWGRLRDLGNQLFAVSRPPAHRSLQAQDRFAKALKEAGQAKRAVLQGLHLRLTQLGITKGDRLQELATTNSRLAALAQTTNDSFKVLTELLAAWPEEGGTADPLRSLVQHCEVISDALGRLNENARRTLRAGAGHASLGGALRDHLSALDERLAAGQSAQPLDLHWINGWNRTADQLIHQIMEHSVTQPATPPGASASAPPTTATKLATPTPPPAPPTLPANVLYTAQLNPRDPDAVSKFLAEVRKALGKLGDGRIQVALVRQEDAE